MFVVVFLREGGKKVICVCGALTRQLEEGFLTWAGADKRPSPTQIKPCKSRLVAMSCGFQPHI